MLDHYTTGLRAVKDKARRFKKGAVVVAEKPHYNERKSQKEKMRVAGEKISAGSSCSDEGKKNEPAEI